MSILRDVANQHIAPPMFLKARTTYVIVTVTVIKSRVFPEDALY